MVDSMLDDESIAAFLAHARNATSEKLAAADKIYVARDIIPAILHHYSPASFFPKNGFVKQKENALLTTMLASMLTAKVVFEAVEAILISKAERSPPAEANLLHELVSELRSVMEWEAM